MSKRSKRFMEELKSKTLIAYILLVIALVILVGRVIYINVTKGKEY